jgi:hypothetical protein
MTTTDTNGLHPCPACNGSGTNLALLPAPLPIGALVAGAMNLLELGYDLPQPRYITVSRTQCIDLQFASDESGAAAVTRWAQRFGGVLTSEPHEGSNGPQICCEVRFDFYGVRVEAYAMIPAVNVR